MPGTPSDAQLSAAELAACTDLLAFIDASPTPFHAVDTVSARLLAAGFRQLPATDAWQREPGRYYMTAGDGALLAFAIPAVRPRGFRIIGAHTDSPNLRLKPRALYDKVGYTQLGVEVYGGALLNSWLDRDLLLAGQTRIHLDRVEGLEALLRVVGAELPEGAPPLYWYRDEHVEAFRRLLDLATLSPTELVTAVREANIKAPNMRKVQDLNNALAAAKIIPF